MPSDSLAIVGGGLSGLLTAWRVAEVNPDVVTHVFETQAAPKWTHHWSFNLSDIPDHLRKSVENIAEMTWPAYDVAFPKRRRRLNIGYGSTNDLRLNEAVSSYEASGRIVLHRGVEVDPEDIRAGSVIDARGYRERDDTLEGYQKFVGLRIRTESPHGLEAPVIMDATVEQIDGYRFFYLLPFGPNELLVEDTYFSDAPHLSENEITSRIHDYVAERGWKVAEIVHRERGVLPMVTATDRNDDSAEIGLRGGFSIAATGFTFPAAISLAEHIAQSIAKEGVEAAPAAIAEFRRSHIRNERYARLLNRMFFGAARPEERYIILQRFYGMRESLISRFYRNGLTLADKVRILVGKPPVPVTRALYNMSEKAYMRRHQERS